jgi:hypothetical protein
MRIQDVTKNGQAAVPKELNRILDDPLPMKCAIRAKFGLKALSPDEWESNNRNKPILYQGEYVRLCATAFPMESARDRNPLMEG